MSKKEYTLRTVVATGIVIGIIFGLIIGSIVLTFSGGNMIIGGFVFTLVLVLSTYLTTVAMKNQTKR